MVNKSVIRIFFLQKIKFSSAWKLQNWLLFSKIKRVIIFRTAGSVNNLEYASTAQMFDKKPSRVRTTVPQVKIILSRVKKRLRLECDYNVFRFLHKGNGQFGDNNAIIGHWSVSFISNRNQLSTNGKQSEFESEWILANGCRLIILDGQHNLPRQSGWIHFLWICLRVVRPQKCNDFYQCDAFHYVLLILLFRFGDQSVHCKRFVRIWRWFHESALYNLYCRNKASGHDFNMHLALLITIIIGTLCK